jgi:hypothetical protein
MPRQITRSGETCTLPQDGLIAIATPGLLFEARAIQSALADYAAVHWSIVAGPAYPAANLVLMMDSHQPAQGYHLEITPNAITIVGNNTAGVFYGVCTLRQLIQQYGRALPALVIDDWPDFQARGVMLDISRDRVPTMDTLYDLIDRLAGWKVNQLQLYMEHTFTYRHHPDVWADASPMTGEEILLLDAYCRQRHIELVPNQNSLGHMERWLKHPRYLPLAEAPDGFIPPWGGPRRPPSTLNPLDPASIDLIRSLFAELLPHFTSSLFNVGGDEPWELGQGRSKEAVEARGGEVYLDYLLQLYRAVGVHGRRMQFWADIIVKYPNLVSQLPNDVIAMVWGYEYNQPGEDDCAIVARSKIPFYVCPGTSAWNTLVGRTHNAVRNIANAAELGLRYGAIGYLNTDWGDNGHWQPLPSSYLGFAYGAAVSWALDANRDLDLPAALDAFAFDDRSGVMGRLAYDLGNIYQITGPEGTNSSLLVNSLLRAAEDLRDPERRLQSWGWADADLRRETLLRVPDQVEAILAPLDRAAMNRSDAALIQDEFRLAGDLLVFAARRLLHLFYDDPFDASTLPTLLQRQRQNWLARSRPGGLADSLARLDLLRTE